MHNASQNCGLLNGIPPEGTLAGLLPQSGGNYHQHPPPNLPPVGTHMNESPYMLVPMKNVRNAMANGMNGNIGIPINNGNGPHNIQENHSRDWNRTSQGTFLVSLMRVNKLQNNIFLRNYQSTSLSHVIVNIWYNRFICVFTDG